MRGRVQDLYFYQPPTMAHNIVSIERLQGTQSQSWLKESPGKPVRTGQWVWTDSIDLESIQYLAFYFEPCKWLCSKEMALHLEEHWQAS